MKTFTILCFALPLISAKRHTPADYAEWAEYKNAYGKVYPREDDESRMIIYFRNKNYIFNNNINYEKGIKSQYLRMNQYGEMYPTDFRAIVNSFNQSLMSQVNSSMKFEIPETFNVPDSIDWRRKGAVTEVKDQGQCGACWAFSAVGAIESQYFIKTGKQIILSEQNLIDCSKNDGNFGCNSGTMNGAFKYINESGGINTEESYPYLAYEDKACKHIPNDLIKVKGYVDIPKGDENALKAAVAYIGPISAAIDARHLSFQFYGSGIYYESNCKEKQLTRGVLIVGYGTSENGQEYWLVKNSCSSIWGEEGYIRIARNKKNHCGIASAASYPII